MILYSRWLNLPIATRQAIALAFGINKKNPTHVVDNHVRDDGYVIGDIESALTVERMQAYLDNKSIDEHVLFETLVAKAEGREVEVVAEPTDLMVPKEDMKPIETPITSTLKPRLTRTKKI